MLINNLLIATSLAVSSLILGCVPWNRERPAYADLCVTKFEFQLPDATSEKIIVLRTYLYNYDAQWSDEPFEQLYSVQYPNQKFPKPEFYVQMIAYEKSAHGIFSSKKSDIPILYDSRQAYITFEDGTRLNANPEIHLGSLRQDFPIDGTEYIRPSPYNINSAEVRDRIPKVTNNKRHGSVYVIFKTSDFNAYSKWHINLGSMVVEGHRLEIPQLELCYHPVKKWIGIEPLMRP